MHYSISDTAEYGDLHAEARASIDDHVRETHARTCSRDPRRRVRAGVDRGDGRRRAAASTAAARRSSSSASSTSATRAQTREGVGLMPTRWQRWMTLQARSLAVGHLTNGGGRRPVALGYGTVGSAVDRLLGDGADDIERATGHRLRRRPRARPRPDEGARPRARRRRADDRLRRDPRRPLDRGRRRGDGRHRADRATTCSSCCARASPSSRRTSSSSRSAGPSSSRPPPRPVSSCASRRASARRSR